MTAVGETTPYQTESDQCRELSDRDGGEILRMGGCWPPRYSQTCSRLRGTHDQTTKLGGGLRVGVAVTGQAMAPYGAMLTPLYLQLGVNA